MRVPSDPQGGSTHSPELREPLCTMPAGRGAGRWPQLKVNAETKRGGDGSPSPRLRKQPGLYGSPALITGL